MKGGESMLGEGYRRLYEALCGRHPNQRPWHFQWLGVFYLHRALRRLLPGLGGRVLDAGCGVKPYRGWLGSVESYTGLDVTPACGADLLVAPAAPWPLPDDRFDTALCSQMLEHAADAALTAAELYRVLKPGGTAVVSAPFIFNRHGGADDYRRFTAAGLRNLFPRAEVLTLEEHGGIGSTLAILLLN